MHANERPSPRARARHPRNAAPSHSRSFAFIRGLARISPPKPTDWRARFGIALLFAAVALMFTAPVYPHPGNWGIQDWDIFLFYHGAPAVTVTEYQQAPLWNPWFCGGMPMLARPESPQLSPMFLITLLLGTVMSLKVQITLHLLIGLAGTYTLARHRAASRTAAILAAFVYMLGGAYTLHMTVGNAWAYTMAFIPWAVLFWLRAAEAASGHPQNIEQRTPNTERRIQDPDFDVGRSMLDVGRSAPIPPRSAFLVPRSAFLCALSLVLMWFGGGPYPMVLTLLFLAAHALFGIATREHRAWPVLRLLVTIGLLTFGLGAIKFLPAMEFMGAYPRTSDMSTGFSLDSLRHGLFGRDQTLHAMDALRRGSGFLHGVSQGMNETGAYIGILPFILFLVGAVSELRRRRIALLLCFLFFLWLSFGVRAPLSAWNALHELPVFSITRVAERFRFLFLLVLALVTAGGLDAITARIRQRWARPWPARILPAALVALVGLDLMVVVSPLLSQAFTISPLAIPAAPGRAFAQTASHYSIGRHGWATAEDDTLSLAWSSHYPALLSNLGIILGNEDTPVPKEAIAIDAPDYPGELFLHGTAGDATYTHWSPNRLTIRVRAATAGDVVVNQNYYPGWRAAGSPTPIVRPLDSLLSVPIPAGESTVTLYYRPTSVVLGAAISLLTVLLGAWWLWRAGRTAAPRTRVGRALQALIDEGPACWPLTARLAALLALASLLAYLPVLNARFVNIDDDIYVTENAHVKTGLALENVRWAFTATERSNYWHPLTWLSHMLDAQLFGLHPAGHHLTSVLIHALNSVLLFLVLARVAGSYRLSVIRYPLSKVGESSSPITNNSSPITNNAPLLPPFLVAALFALHPLHVESVAWISERKDVLSTLFWLLTLGAYAGYARAKLETGNWKVGGGNAGSASRPTASFKFPVSSFQWYVLTLLCFLCGLMAKPMLVTLPFALLLLDWWPLQRMARAPSVLFRLLLEKIPFLLLAGAAAAWAFVAQREGDALRSLDQYPLGVRLANAVVSYAAYLWHTLWPHGLTIYYPHPGTALPSWQPLAAVLLLTAITVAVLWNTRRHPYLFTGWFWYLGTLVPVIGLVQIGSFARADRYTYVPLIGIFIMLAWGVAEVRNWKLETRNSKLVRRNPGCRSGRLPSSQFPVSSFQFMLPTALALGILLSWRQLRHWKDSETLFTHNLTVVGSNAVGHDGLGFALLERGEFAAAATHFEASIRLFPDAVRTRFRLGLALAGAGRLDDAIAAYRQTLALANDYADAWLNLGIALMQRGQPRDAADCFQQALKAEPDRAEAFSNLGIVQCAQGQLEEGLRNLEQAVRLRPDNAESRNNLGRALILIGRLEEAELHLQQALQLKPDYADARQNLVDVRARQQRQRAPEGPSATTAP